MLLNPKSAIRNPKSCLNTVFVQAMTMILFWAVAGASPIGYPTTREQILQSGDSSFKSALRFSPKNWLDADIWLSPSSDDDFSDSLFDRGDEKKRPAVSVTAYLFSYGSYLHEWEQPFFEAWTLQGFATERPFAYKGPLSVPGYASGPVSGKFAYPYSQMFPIGKQSSSLDAFSRKYAAPAEESKFVYPHGQLAPKGAAQAVSPGSGPRFASPGGGSGEGGLQGGGSQGAGAGKPYGYGAPSPESGYPPGQSPMEQRIMEEKFNQEKGGIEQFRQERAVSRAAGKPYGMILFGAGLAAIAALFRMFRLSLVIMVGWIIFYGRDIWRIIVDLV